MNSLVSKLLVINEWLFHDLQGDNEQKAQDETLRFLQTLHQRQDRIAILYGDNPWIRKFHGLMKHESPHIRNLSRFLRTSIIQDSSKCVYRHQSDIEAADIPADAIAAAPEEDIYLIELYYAAQADLLVTTDHGLHNAFAPRDDVEIAFRDEFLEGYLR